MAAEHFVRYETDGPVAVITLDRPQAANAQTAGILAFVTSGIVPNASRRFYFVGIDNARFRKPVEPGDQLLLSAKLERSFKGIWRFSTVARVGENEVAHADMMVAPEVSK